MSNSIIEWLCENCGFSESVLTELRNSSLEELYNIYEIRARKGHRRRVIEEPIPLLKKVQQALIPLYREYPLHAACTARKGSSFVENAKAHEGAKHVLKVDIRKCYPSTTFDHLHNAIQAVIDDVPVYVRNLWHDGLRFCLIPSKLLPNYVPWVLPTGAPTSPILCNIALTPLDYLVASLVERHGYTYTRYMDDLIISTKNKDRLWSILSGVDMLIRSRNYEINQKKTRWLMTEAGNEKVIITGVRIGRGSKVPREFRRTLRAKLQNLAKQGKDLDAEAIGCLAYVKSIDKEKYGQFLSYYERRRQYEPDP